MINAKNNDEGIEPFLSVREVCLLFGVSSKTIYRWIEGRNMPNYTIGGVLRFRASSLEQWVDKIQEGEANERQKAKKIHKRRTRKKVSKGV